MNDDDRSEREPTADEQALTALFAALVQDSPPSEVSPEAVIEQALQDHDAALDQRIKRLKLGRNLLIAAGFAGLVVIFVPKLGHLSRTATSSVSSSAASSAAAPAAAPSADGAAAATSASSAQGSAAGSSAVAATV